jgi:hypothetical protein
MFLNSSGGRDGFLPTALLLGRAGAASLVLQMTDSDPDEMALGMKHDVVAIRRAYD